MSEERDSTPALSYNEAIGELREILKGIEEEDVDLDELGAQVERAAVLIRMCRERIVKTEMSVRAVLDDLEKDGDHEG